jgi:hypothetical protein
MWCWSGLQLGPVCPPSPPSCSFSFSPFLFQTNYIYRGGTTSDTSTFFLLLPPSPSLSLYIYFNPILIYFNDNHEMQPLAAQPRTRPQGQPRTTPQDRPRTRPLDQPLTRPQGQPRTLPTDQTPPPTPPVVPTLLVPLHPKRILSIFSLFPSFPS